MTEQSDFLPSAPTSLLVRIALAVLCLGIVGGLALPWFLREKGVSNIDRVTATLQTALVFYKKEFGSFPAGDSRAVSNALQGANPKQIHFIDLSRREVSPEGDLLDPWGTPFMFYFSDERPLIRSAGPNKQFDNSTSSKCDDYFRG